MSRNQLKLLQPLLLLLIVGGFYIQFQNSFITAKVIHILALISWFAGLFYLPRLYVYHAMSESNEVNETLKVMEHKLFHYIMTPAAVLTVQAGIWMIELWQWTIPLWLWAKIALVALLVLFHIQCWKILHQFKEDRNEKPHTYYRFFNEAPTLLLIAVVILVVAKPLF